MYMLDVKMADRSYQIENTEYPFRALIALSYTLHDARTARNSIMIPKEYREKVARAASARAAHIASELEKYFTA